MLKVVCKGVKVFVAVTAVALVLTTGFRGGAGPAKDPLVEWVYPKAKPTGEGGNQAPLIWRVFTAKDPFEKVWEFYGQKLMQGVPAKKEWRGKEGGTMVGAEMTPSGELLKTMHTYFYDPNPKGKIGVMVFRRRDQTVSVTVWQRVGEKETNILVAVDQR